MMYLERFLEVTNTEVHLKMKKKIYEIGVEKILLLFSIEGG
ncbi:hypothetical protein [Clostridium disporicum]